MLNSQAVDLKGKSHLNRQILHGKDDYPLMQSIGQRLRVWKSEVKARPLLLVEWCGAGLGVLGAEVLAQKSAYSAYGWVIWLVSNLLWIVFALKKRAFGLLAMQLVFTFTSLQGAVNWLL